MGQSDHQNLQIAPLEPGARPGHQRRSLGLLAILVAAAFPVACTDGRQRQDPPMTESPEDRSLPANAEIQLDPDRGTIRFLRARDLSAELDGDAAFIEPRRERRFDLMALAFVAAHRSAFQLARPNQELDVVSVTTDDIGLTHIRLRQMYRGLPIEGSQLIVHINESHQVYLVNGSYVPTPGQLQTIPALRADEARLVVSRATGEDCRECPTDLVIHAPRTGPARLAYRVRVSVSFAEGWQFMVDAETGAVLQKLPTVVQGTPPSVIVPGIP